MDRTSAQSSLGRLRHSRVRITCDVQIGQNVKQVELPFVVGVLADLSGHPKQALLPFLERRAVFIDRDNFNEVMDKAGTRLAIQVLDKLNEANGNLAVELDFKHIDDFEPTRVAEQIAPLKELLETRRALREVGVRAGFNDRLERLLEELLADPERAAAAARALNAPAQRPAASPATAQTDAAEPSAAGLFDLIIDTARSASGSELERTQVYFRRFLEEVVKPGRVVANDFEANLKRWIDDIDRQLSSQLNEVLHHPDFQKLEATWRGLHYLVRHTETGETLKIRVLNVSKRELREDQAQAPSFDESALAKKIYDEEYYSFGGKPYGLLVGDFVFDRSPEDIALLQRIGQVAAFAQAPFVAAASARMFGFETDFTELSKPRDLIKMFEGLEFDDWHAFRATPQARYVALTLPRVLARRPYGDEGTRVEEFCFEELADSPEHGKHLWMSAAWAFALCVTTAYAKHGWLYHLRGIEGGGKVDGLPLRAPATYDDALNGCTEVAINERREFELGSLGFLPLLGVRNADFAVFFSTTSCAKPKPSDDPAAAWNALAVTQLNFSLCAARFVQYFGIMRIGKLLDTVAFQRLLNDWISAYVAPSSTPAADLARFPLRAATVAVHDMPTKPGWWQVTLSLRLNDPSDPAPPLLQLVAEMPKPM